MLGPSTQTGTDACTCTLLRLDTAETRDTRIRKFSVYTPHKIPGVTAVRAKRLLFQSDRQACKMATIPLARVTLVRANWLLC